MYIALGRNGANSNQRTECFDDSRMLWLSGAVRLGVISYWSANGRWLIKVRLTEVCRCRLAFSGCSLIYNLFNQWINILKVSEEKCCCTGGNRIPGFTVAGREQWPLGYRGAYLYPLTNLSLCYHSTPTGRAVVQGWEGDRCWCRPLLSYVRWSNPGGNKRNLRACVLCRRSPMKVSQEKCCCRGGNRTRRVSLAGRVPWPLGYRTAYLSPLTNLALCTKKVTQYY